jgi:endogenous inhibitor of DNA gyrase (YacG/DUF329 family)
MADLGRWLSGDYRVPGTPQRSFGDDTDAEDDAEMAPTPDVDRRR